MHEAARFWPVLVPHGRVESRGGLIGHWLRPEGSRWVLSEDSSLWSKNDKDIECVLVCREHPGGFHVGCLRPD